MGLFPKLEDIPARMKVGPSQDREVARVISLDWLRSLNPYLVVKNTGREPIHGFRVETRADLIVIHDPAQPMGAYLLARNDWTISQAEQEDFALPRKLQPGESAKIPLASGLVSQIMNNRQKEQGNQSQLAFFRINVYCRIVGMDSFDGDQSRSDIQFRLAWLPEGFPEEKCRAYLEGWKRIAEIQVD